MIHLVEVHNPFQPATSRTLHQVEWREGMVLADVLAAAGISPVRHACVIDGLAVPEEMLAGYPVQDCTNIITLPSVAGGGFGKLFAEIGVILASVAATVLLGPAGAGIWVLGQGVVGASTATLIGSAIAIGGNMLVNAFMQPSMGGGPDSASWDPTGPKTVASGGTPIPKGYGSYRSGGNIIASYVDAEGADNYLNVLVSFGFGPARSISDIRINNNSISNYTDAVYQMRLGTNNQTPIPYFNRIVNGYPQAVRCNAGDPVVIEGTGTQTQGAEIVVQFPDGVFWSEDNGSLRSLAISYKVEYSVHGSGVWNTLIVPFHTTDVPRFNNNGTMSYPGWIVVPTDTKFSSGVVYAYDNDLSPTAHTPGDPWSGTSTVTYYEADGSSHTGPIFLRGEWQPYDPNLGQEVVQDWSSGYEIFVDANQGTLYHTTKIPNLSPARYDWRVTKYGSAFAGDPIQPREANNNRTGDQVWIHTINEIQYQDLAYPNMVLLGVRALATNQLSGGDLNVTAQVVYGVRASLPAELASYGEDNPAVVAYDMLIDDLYGGRTDTGCIDLPAFADWAEYCDEMVADGNGGQQKRHVFNGIHDQQGTNLWRCLQKVATMASAAIVQVGRNYTVVVDRPVTVPAQIFTSANIVRDSMKDTWLSLDDRSNKIEVTFADADRDYRTDEPCSVMLPDDIAAGVEVKTTRVNLLGCTNRAQAWHWAYRKLDTTKKCLLTRSFDVGVEAIACQVGSVIGVQDDVTEWASGGRIQPGSATTGLIIDRDDLTFASGQGYTVAVQHPVVQRGTRTVQSIAGNVVTFTATLPSGRIVQAVTAGGTEIAVRGYGGSAVELESATGITTGQGLTLYDQDVIDTQPVASVAGTTVVPLNPFLQTPTADCPWVYGQSGGAFPAKLFTVTAINKKGNLQRTIDALIYSAPIDDTPIITQTLGVPDVNAAVTNLTATERYVLANGANGGQDSLIALGWQSGPNTAATQIWIARNETNQPLSGEVLVATVNAGQSYTFNASTGSILQIRAVGVDVAGGTAPFSTAPVVTITVQGSGLAPANVSNFAGVTSSGGNAFTWDSASGAAKYELRYNADINNTDWASATLLYSGTALSYTDTTLRTGLYLLKALSSTSVESVTPATWSYLQSPTRYNVIGLAPGQTVDYSIVENSYDATSGLCTLKIGVPSQSLTLTDGSPVTIPASGVQWITQLAPATTYYLYLYLAPYTFTVGCSTGGNTVPDTAPNNTDLVGSYSAGNYQIAAAVITTVGTSGSGGTSGGFTGGGGGRPPSGGDPINNYPAP